MDQRRIIIYTQCFAPQISGSGVQARLLAEAMAHAGHEVAVFTEALGVDDESWPFSVYHEFSPRSFFWAARHADVVLLMGPGLRAMFPALLARTPVAVSHVMVPGSGWRDRCKLLA